jgi:hypothetical protein
MSNKKALNNLIGALLFLAIFQSCGKEWLEVKPDKSLIVPKSVEDYQKLIDNSSLFNNGQSIGMGEIGAGDFYLVFAGWESLFNKQEKSAYIWAPTENFYGTEQSVDWVNGYRRILNANVILEGINKVRSTSSEQQSWNNVKGSALFFRAFDYFNLAQEYCIGYDLNTASTNLGLPLRTEYDVNVKVQRSNLQQTYDRIIGDLLLAVDLLGTSPAYKTRPSKQAVYALLARVYLVMEKYQEAGYYSDLALQVQSDLLDYKTLNDKSPYPLERFNVEVIFQSTFFYGTFSTSRLIVKSELYDSYSNNDCRKYLYFMANTYGMTFRGSYSGDRNLFGGLTTGELYLIRAEARVRNNQIELALADLNLLRKKRWKSNYQDLTGNNALNVLKLILQERQRELAFRGIRWTDLRRLNKDDQFAVTLTRTMDGTTYKLLPNDKKYVIPIDEEELRLGGIEQNER